MKEGRAGIGAKALLSAGAGVSVASATVFIMPTDIDQYKVKSDQVFYDTYQNDQSMVAGGANPLARKIIKDSGVDTSARFMEGSTLERPNATILAGQNLRAGEVLKFKLPISGANYTYTLRSDKKTGEVRIEGPGAHGAEISLSGDLAMNKGSKYCVSSGKNGCYVYAQDRTNISYNVYSGELRMDRVQYAANSNCGKYSCTEGKNYYPRMVKTSDSRFYSVASLYDNNRVKLVDLQQGKTYEFNGGMEESGSSSQGGKYYGS